MSSCIITEAVGRAWDAPTVCYKVGERESLIGVEITDVGGMLDSPHIGVFITCGLEGRKVVLTATEARDLASSLNDMADRLEAGATRAGDDA